MTLEIRRLHLAALRGPDGGDWPVHGFVIIHPGGAALVDTGVGGPDELLSDWRVVNRTAADALAGIGMSPADIGLVINTHLHFDHCGQNAVFAHAPVYVQRAELARAQREAPELCEWLGFMNASFELLDGDAEIMPGVSVITTPGHTAGHQSVVVRTGDGSADLLIGDAAYTPQLYAGPQGQELPPGQAADREAWEASIGRIRSSGASVLSACRASAASVSALAFSCTATEAPRSASRRSTA